MEDDPVTLTASQAAELLGVRRETLYAYVSRGQIHSEPGPDGRTSRYRRADIERLLRQKAVRRRPETAAEGALHFGSPVLESGVSQLGDGRIHYRGLDARRLAGERRVEEVAAWLWLGDFEAAESLFVADPAVPDGVASILAVTGSPWRLESLQAILPILGLADPSAWAARDRTELARVGARIVASMIEVVTSSTTDSGGLAERLAAGWTGAGASALDSVDAVELLGACLILCADHELNVSTFTARCVASAGSPLHSVVAAGLAALQGPKHGGHTRRVEALFREAGSPDGVRAAFEDR
ncbi:MAG: citrate/2-methylcitrate synthase, partial [Acidobacteriota bacterium]